MLATIGAVLCLAAVPATSLAQSLSNDAYSNQTTQVLGTSEENAPTSSGTLPFTGLQIALVGLAGIVLVGSGFALRRVNRSSSS